MRVSAYVYMCLSMWWVACHGTLSFLISSISSSEMASEIGWFFGFSTFYAETSPGVFSAPDWNLCHMKALDKLHFIVFEYRWYLRRKWRLKTGHFTVSLVFFCARNSSEGFTAHKQNSHLMKSLDEQHVVTPLVYEYRWYLRRRWRLELGNFDVSLLLCGYLL